MRKDGSTKYTGTGYRWSAKPTDNSYESRESKSGQACKNLGADVKQAEIMAKHSQESRTTGKGKKQLENGGIQKLLEVSIYGAQGMLKPSQERIWTGN